MNAREVTRVTSPNALRIPDHRVDSGVADRGEDALRIGEPGRERLLDQQRQLALDRREDRIDVQVLVGRDDRGRHLGAREQLAVVVCHEVRADFFPDELCPIGLDLGQADEVDLRMARRDLAAEHPDPATADDGEADALGGFLRHRESYAAARTGLDPFSGSATDSLRSADRSAAM